MSLGLGDIDKAALNAISDKLIASVPGIEQPFIDELHSDIAALVQAEKDGISQAGSVIQADLAPVVEQMKEFNANVTAAIALLRSIKDDGIPVSAMLFGGKK